jgi:hypothetical protein
MALWIVAIVFIIPREVAAIHAARPHPPPHGLQRLRFAPRGMTWDGIYSGQQYAQAGMTRKLLNQ